MYITAHSGCDKTPDNSMEFILHALTLSPKIDALEIDIRPNSKGILVVTHNEEEADSDSVLTLSEAFTAIANGSPVMKVNCDIKISGIELDVIKTADECNLARNRIIFSGSVTPYEKGKWPVYMKDVQVYLNTEQLIPGFNDEYGKNPQNPGIAMKMVLAFVNTGCAALNIYHGLLNPQFIAFCRMYGVSISAWTASDDDSIKKCNSYGVLNITSRTPMRAAEICCK